MPFPLLAIAAPALISAGAGIISNMMNKPSAAEQGLQRSVLAKNQAETAILQQRQRMLDTLWGRTSNFANPILGAGGEKFAFRLPGVGGGKIDTNAQLTELINAINFGDKREFDAMMGVLGQATSGNSAGAAVAQNQNLATARRAGTSGIADLIAGIGQAAFDEFGPPSRALPTPTPGPTSDDLGTLELNLGDLLTSTGLPPVDPFGGQ